VLGCELNYDHVTDWKQWRRSRDSHVISGTDLAQWQDVRDKETEEYELLLPVSHGSIMQPNIDE